MSRKTSFTVKWLATNFLFGGCVIYGTFAPSRLFIGLAVVATLYYLVTCLLTLLPAVREIVIPKNPPITRTRMVADFLFDAGMLTFLCVYAGWYLWLPYLIASAISVWFLLYIRTYQLNEQQGEARI